MKMAQAMSIIEGAPPGYMVSFEWWRGGMLESDHFPDKHSGEQLIPTEAEAWELARKFAEKMARQVVNIYVIGNDFVPVQGYADRMLLKHTL